MQIARLFEMVYLLMHKKSITAKELAAHFEVSVRTILRDIDTLAQAGVPVYTTQGKGGGISLMDNYVLDKATISEDEQNQIIFALQGLASTPYSQDTQVLSKLSSLFNKTDIDWIEVDFSRWGNEKPDQERFELLKTAILNQQAIAFNYYNSNGETTSRSAYPLKLIFKSTSWYLQAFCLLKNDYRTFKINRMLDPKLLQDRLVAQKLSPPPLQTDNKLPTFIQIRLLFKATAAYRIYDEFDHQDITKNPDGSFEVKTTIPHDYWLYSYLLSMGSDVKIIEPTSVKNNLLKIVKEIQNSY